MEVDDLESAPASPDADESVEQVWSPSQSRDGGTADSDRGPASPLADGAQAETEEEDNTRSSDAEGDSASQPPNSGPGSPLAEASGSSVQGDTQDESGPASPEPEEQSVHDSPARLASSDEDDALNLEETEEERKGRQTLRARKETKSTGKSAGAGEERTEHPTEQHQKTDAASTLHVKSRLAKGEVSNQNKSAADDDVLNTSKSSLHDDHGELDYDEEIHEETAETDVPKGLDEEETETGSKAQDSSEKTQKSEEGEAGEHKNEEGDEGEVEDDDDCEEGEIKEPGTKKPFTRPICRFYNRGNCTWGTSCRFLHPGVNDKGNYSLIERPERPGLPGVFSRLGPPRNGGQWLNTDRTVGEELPPPPASPPTETAWERGLRQAKEIMKRANKRKETETNFEEKRMNLNLEDEKDFNKENDRGRVVKDPYYDNVYEEDDEYYNKGAWENTTVTTGSSNHWHGGHYENFEVRWTREPDYRPPHLRTPPYERERLRERLQRERRMSPESERIRTTVHQPSAVFLPVERRMSPETERLRYEKRRVERSDRYDKYDKYDKYDRPAAYDRPLPYSREDRPDYRAERSAAADRLVDHRGAEHNRDVDGNRGGGTDSHPRGFDSQHRGEEGGRHRTSSKRLLERMDHRGGGGAGGPEGLDRFEYRGAAGSGAGGSGEHHRGPEYSHGGGRGAGASGVVAGGQGVGDRLEEPSSRKRGDEWHDPWSRAKKSPQRRRSTSRSRSRGRQRHRSFSRGSRGSSSSSYTSSSYSSRSRSGSRSSSYSSASSRSSRSSSSSLRSSSRSRSRSRPNRRPLLPGPVNSREFRPGPPLKPGEVPKSTVTVKPGPRSGHRGGPAERGPDNRPPPPTAGVGVRGPSRGLPPGPLHQPSPNRSSAPTASGRGERGPLADRVGPQPPLDRPGPGPALPPQHSRGPGPHNLEKKPPGASGPGRPKLPPAERGRPREREPPARGIPRRASLSGSSSGSSRSRSMSSSSSLSRSASASSRSSVTSSSSSSSSGSADSEHLYRDIAHGDNVARSPSASYNAAGQGAGQHSPSKGLRKSSTVKKKSKKDLKLPQAPQPKPVPAPPQDRRRVSARDKGHKDSPSAEKRPSFPAPRPESRGPEARNMDGRGSEGRVAMDSRSNDVRLENRPDGRFDGRDRTGRDRGGPPDGRAGMDPPGRERRSEGSRSKRPEELARSGRSGEVAPSMPPVQRRNNDGRVDDRPRSSQPQTVMKSIKQDPLKLSGQKSNIKLTLINKSADKSGPAKKRQAPDLTSPGGAPPSKRPAPTKGGPVKDVKSVPKGSPAVTRSDKARLPPPKPKLDDKSPSTAGKRSEPGTPKPAPATAAAPPAPVPAPKAKKSASSRREELLKQLKAVEDAIARKRAKMS